jgi:hypothetical protein
MTPAEQALFDGALNWVDQDELTKLRAAVLTERLPEGYEIVLKQLVLRYHEAWTEMNRYAATHPMGGEIRDAFRKELRNQ